MIIISSNPGKIAEIKQHLGNSVDVETGPDIQEVLGSWSEVIIHKALMAGSGFVVEDTIIFVNSVEMVDIKWGVDRLQEGDLVTWKTSFGHNDGKQIIVYSAETKGFVTRTRGKKGFSFDPYFVPNELKKQFLDNLPCTLAEMEVLDKKSDYSARIRALRNLQNNRVELKINISDIQPWNGKWQKAS